MLVLGYSVLSLLPATRNAVVHRDSQFFSVRLVSLGAGGSMFVNIVHSFLEPESRALVIITLGLYAVLLAWLSRSQTHIASYAAVPLLKSASTLFVAFSMLFTFLVAFEFKMAKVDSKLMSFTALLASFGVFFSLVRSWHENHGWRHDGMWLLAM